VIEDQCFIVSFVDVFGHCIIVSRETTPQQSCEELWD
jgi:hypothetical protein